MNGIPITKNRCFIIAEAGVNHNGSLSRAKALVDAAAASGADAVKFQTFRAEDIVTKIAAKADYQKRNTRSYRESQFAMLKKLELQSSDFIALKRYCDRKGIMFLSTPFDLKSVDLLEHLVPLYKISSGDLTNSVLLRYVASKRKLVILSTGMATVEEIRNALKEINSVSPRSEKIILHCTTNYPCPYNEVNLRAMQSLKRIFRVPVGYSDHTQGIEVPIAAVSLGARVIEKHFTLSKRLPGPDHKASLEPREFKSMVDSVRSIEQALGSGAKKPTKSELEIKKLVRRSLVAAKDLPAGYTLKNGDILVKRPGGGITPSFYSSVIGMKTKTVIRKDEPLKWPLLTEMRK